MIQVFPSSGVLHTQTNNKNNSNKNKDILIGHSCNGAFQGLMKQNDETNNADNYNIVKNPNWQEPDLLAISKHEASVNQETTPA